MQLTSALAAQIAAANLAGRPYSHLRARLVEALESEVRADYADVHMPGVDRHLHHRVMACAQADRLITDRLAELRTQTVPLAPETAYEVLVEHGLAATAAMLGFLPSRTTAISARWT